MYTPSGILSVDAHTTGESSWWRTASPVCQRPRHSDGMPYYLLMRLPQDMFKTFTKESPRLQSSSGRLFGTRPNDFERRMSPAIKRSPVEVGSSRWRAYGTKLDGTLPLIPGSGEHGLPPDLSSVELYDQVPEPLASSLPRPSNLVDSFALLVLGW